MPGTRVLVATWIGSQAACESYADPNSTGCKAGQECQHYAYNSWVTVAPELKDLLGNAPTFFVLPGSWYAATRYNTDTGKHVHTRTVCIPSDLFRPSADRK